MKQVPFLRTLYRQSLTDSLNATPLERVMGAYLDNTPIDGRIIEQAIQRDAIQSHVSPWEIIDQWRLMITLLLVLHDKDLLQPCRHLLVDRLRDLMRLSSWREFQLFSTYRAIAACLLGRREEKIAFSQLPSGACQTEWGGHWAWGEVPQPLFHAELGILLCLYSQIKQDSQYLEAATRLAEWQLNTLDHRLMPFSGLFTHENDASEPTLLVNNFLLFDSVARLTGRPDLSFVADKQMEHFSALAQASVVPISPLAVALETWLTKHGPPLATVPHRLPQVFQDAHLNMVGCRQAETSAVATLYGAGSGMGCFHGSDVQVVNFGPQHQPLGDCLGFGIEGGPRLLSQQNVSMSASHEGFILEGLARMTSRPRDKSLSSEQFRAGDHAGCWIDMKQKFEKGRLDIETSFKGIAEMSSLAFAFFVKAQACLVEGQPPLKPRSFGRYQGNIQPIHLQGSQSKITLKAAHQGQMEIIPLGSSHNFWGADFLIAFPLTQSHLKFSLA